MQFVTFSSAMSNRKVVCFLTLLTSSVICCVMVTSSGILVRSSEHRHVKSSPLVGVVETVIANASDGDHGNVTTLNKTASINGTRSHLLVPKNGKTIINNSLTGSLWNFADITDEHLYLYENLLKQKWIPNITKTETLRQELAKYRSVLEGTAQVILDQKNTKPKQVMKFVFGNKIAKPMPSTLFGRFPKTNPLPQGKRYRSCAVVGNSGIMLNSSCGKDVDKHDYVFRCNLPPLPPFKKDAGMKSNFTTMNPSIAYRKYKGLGNKEGIRKFNADISNLNGVLWMPCYNMFYSFTYITRAFSSFKGNNYLKMVCGNPEHFKSVRDFWVERELNNRLSCGFYLVTTAIQLCDEVQLYGFWPFSVRYGDAKSDVPYHYYDDLSSSGANSVHSMDKEFSLLVQLHTLGILRLNVGSCS